MSKHPLGPWSETVLSTTFSRTGGKLIEERVYPPTSPPLTTFISSSPSLAIGIAVTKSGVNNGGPTDVPSDATYQETSADYVGASFEYLYKSAVNGNKWHGTCDEITYTPTWGAIPGDLNLQSVKDAGFNAFVNKQGSTFQGLTFLGEFASFKKDLRFVASTITGRHNEAYKLLVKNLVKNKRGSKRDLLTIVSDHWLQLQFGILPDIHDMQDLIQGLKDTVSGTPKSRKITGKHIDDVNYQYPVKSMKIDGWPIELRESVTRKIVAKFGGTIRADYVNKDSANSLTFGYGLEDFVPALWELTPFSWLVDYFSNVGNFVNLLSLRRGKFVNGWYLTIDESVYQSQIHPYDGHFSNYTFLSSSDGLVKKKVFAFHRSPVALDSYIPDFHFEMPNLRQAANIAAVAATSLIKPGEASKLLNRPDLARRG